MLENELRFSEMDNAGALRPTDIIPIMRDNAPADPTNEAIFGSQIQGRIWFPEITAYLGGVNTLEKLITVGVLAGARADLYMDSQFQVWVLFAGDEETDASASSSDPAVRGTTEIVRPEDYADTTNEKVWKRVL